MRLHALTRPCALFLAAVLPAALAGCTTAPCAGFDGECGAVSALAESGSLLTCDYSNPCTTTVNCTPCSELPRAEQRHDACTPDDELPAFCAGRRGCTEVPWTSGAIDECFPVAGTDHEGAPGPQVGKCCAGTCVFDDVACGS
jgi:hypothetical protein